MDFSELKQNLKNEIKPAYVIYGSDGFLRHNAIGQLKARIANPEANISTHSDDGNAFLKILEMYPLFSDYRLVIVNNPKKCANALLAYLDTPNKTSILAVVYDEAEPPAAIKKKAEPVVCEKLEERHITAYIKTLAERRSAAFSPQGAALLINYAQGDMSYIVTEVEKLCAYAGSAGTVTEVMVKSVCEPLVEYKLYELTDALGKKDAGKAEPVINNLLYNRTEPTVILSSLYTHFRRLLHLSLHKDKELAQDLGVKPYSEKMMRSQAGNFSQVNLKKISDMLADYEYRIKSGRLDPTVALDAALTGIIGI